MQDYMSIHYISMIGLTASAVTLIFCAIRMRKGPTLADRVLALDLMTTCMMGILALYALYSDQAIFVDVVIVFALVAFISTVVFAKHIERDVALRANAASEADFDSDKEGDLS